MAGTTDKEHAVGLAEDEKVGDVHFERAQLLADLPDPDAGLSEEERAAIVGVRFLGFIECLLIGRLLGSKGDVESGYMVDPLVVLTVSSQPSTAGSLWTDTRRYLLSFLDRTNIGNARLAGMETKLNMSGTDYNMSLTIFFISYAIAEPITNTLLKRLTPRIFFTGIIILWGLISK